MQGKAVSKFLQRNPIPHSLEFRIKSSLLVRRGIDEGTKGSKFHKNKMKIYFVAAIRGGRGDREWYLQIIPLLKQYGTVVTEHVGTGRFTSEGKESMDVSDEEIYERDMRWIKEADAIVAEVTTASLGVGYELHRAEDLDKRVLCLYREHDERNLSPMIAGNPKLRVAPYVILDDVKKIFEEFFEESPFPKGKRPKAAAKK